MDGSLIRAAREALGLSQDAIAVQVGISQEYLSQLERGEKSNATIKVLCRLARVLKLDLAALACDADERAA